jgi:hypothetical protein
MLTRPIHLIYKASTAQRRPVASRRLKRCLAIGVMVMLVGCAQEPTPAPGPSRPIVRVQPPDWFHQQVALARAARRAHQPKTDVTGAQAAYDNVMRNACTQAAVAGPGKYPARCDAVLHPSPSQAITASCDADPDDPAVVTECND